MKNNRSFEQYNYSFCGFPVRVDRLITFSYNIVTILGSTAENVTIYALFIKFLPVFSGVTTYDHKAIDFNETLAVDACLNSVVGDWKMHVYTCTLPKYLTDNKHFFHHTF